jgi:hypothetical protein
MGQAHEWDIVAEDAAGKRLLLAHIGDVAIVSLGHLVARS